MSFQSDVRKTLSKIEVQMGIMNAELKEHTRRSTMLEDRVVPLEQNHMFFNKLTKVVMALVGLAVSIGTAYQLFFK